MISTSIKFPISALVLDSCRLLTGCGRQDFNDSVLLMNDHLTKDAFQETLYQPDDPWITAKTDTKPYILELLDSTKLTRSQSVSTWVINYGHYISHMFDL